MEEILRALIYGNKKDMVELIDKYEGDFWTDFFYHLDVEETCYAEKYYTAKRLTRAYHSIKRVKDGVK